MASTFSGVLALDHTAVAVWSFESVLPFYRDLLGGEVVAERDVPASSYRFLQLRYPNGAQVELIAPLGESGFLHDFLAKRGEGPHHLTFIVADLKAAVAAARAAGYRVVGESYDTPHWQEAFVSPRDLHGTLVQLAQKGPG
jgi:methylmalonyl-CoA/ethylmalonyl-CoA epimerase